MILQTSVCLHKRVRLQEKVDQSSSSFFVCFFWSLKSSLYGQKM